MAAETSIVSGITGRYATALFDLALDASNLDEVAGDLAKITALFDESEDMIRLVRSPLIGRENQAKAMAAVLEKVGVCDLVRRFVGIVAQNSRLFVLTGIIKDFDRLHARHRGEIVAEVTSAKSLTKGQLTAVSKALAEAVGSDVKIDAKIDERLIGGLTIKVGSQMIDSSVRTKLQNLQLAMKGVG